MARFARLTGPELVKVLEEYGFAEARTQGSHRFMKHTDGRCTTVPMHARETIAPGLLSKICRDTSIGKDDMVPGRGKELAKAQARQVIAEAGNAGLFRQATRYTAGAQGQYAQQGRAY
ncbi:MAG: type II toxin-antitoxin system HicA family toxin [Verrucomicrobium sp.]|nr:type II toxin-antitoxin system HicA family toxin [Verrucomicrobium sp.]